MSIRDFWILFFCRLGGVGLGPKAPGTWGTALACVLAPVLFVPLPLGARIVLLALLFVGGALASTQAEMILGRQDPDEVVIDELVGVWLAVLPFAHAGFWTLFWAFVFFRIFDILKPWPVKNAESWGPAGWGIMLDDVMAGLWAMLCVAVMYWLGLA